MSVPRRNPRNKVSVSPRDSHVLCEPPSDPEPLHPRGSPGYPLRRLLMRRRMLRSLLPALFLVLATGQSSARDDPERPSVVIVLDDRFEGMKVKLELPRPITALGGNTPKRVFARQFKDDRETTGFALRIGHARPIQVPKSKRFADGTRGWNDVLVRYPFQLSWRQAGKPVERPIAKGEVRGESSPVQVKEVQVVTIKYELRIVSLADLTREAAEKALTPHEVATGLDAALMPMIATPDRTGSLIGGIQHKIRPAKKDPTVVVPLKNRLPVRVTGELSCSLATEPARFALKPGEALNLTFPVDKAPGKNRSTVSLRTLRLEPPAP